MPALEPRKPKRIRTRTRYNVDAECLAVIDGEIARAATNGPLIQISRPQMVNLLLERALSCACDAEKRPLPATPPDAQPGAIDVDLFAHDLLRNHAKGLAATRPIRLSRHVILRMLLLRAARCTCNPLSFRPIEDPVPADGRARADAAAGWMSKPTHE